GSLDYDDDVLAQLDWVVASPHVALRQETKKATDRLIKAIENPYVNVIGHPTGRLINARAGLPLDFGRIFEAAADTDTALEINASYQRLDLAAEQAKAAVAAGCKLSINTDAHQPEGLGKLSGGIATARRGWVTKKDVVNCMTLAQLRKFVDNKRG
ncbi:MAG: DNA polymerase/3'-5' exonuclease PolX, partial [Planctomycetota bacterium]